MEGAGSNRMAHCKKCSWKCKYPPKTSISNLKIHSCPAENTISVDGTVDGTKSKKQRLLLQDETGTLSVDNNSIYQHQNLRKAISEMVVVDELPYAFVEKVGFKNVLQVARYDYNQIGRKAVEEDIKKYLAPAYLEGLFIYFYKDK